jgi:CheY-like chemotaxis protein
MAASVSKPTTAPAKITCSPGVSSRHRDVLVVDDDDFVRHALKRLLVTDGRQCVAAGSVEGAQQLLALHAPALVITDLNLGGRLNGIDLIVWMRRSPRLAGVPALLMTGDDPDETRVRLDAAGLPDVEILAKPFERGALTRLLERARG